jgi:hypothetical protein
MNFGELFEYMLNGNFREMAVSIIMHGGKEELISTLAGALNNWEHVEEAIPFAKGQRHMVEYELRLLLNLNY